MSSFKVMPWLRALRDRHAEEEKGMSIKERLEKHRRETEPLVREFLTNHPEARQPESATQSQVAEDHTRYGSESAPE